ncbi:hypothetical protein [Methanoculleus sp. 7T]|uniref:hypothetical protein n=1 Tax=Methanoculleus sp. 7T TaxID=2937282 RepID=UPI0020C16E9E|nr:hypothetical protein [Methanoculleus sp. 7T]MCK8518670.1 hypothetical protein [Methanoculleus sp. 7T]
MNRKIERRALPLLLVILLGSGIVVPMASAQTSVDVIGSERRGVADADVNRNLADSVIITPDFSSQEIVVSPSLAEEDLITLVFPEYWIQDKNTANYPDRVELTDAQEILKNEYFDEETGLRYFSPVQITETQSLTVLRIPKKMFELSLTTNDGGISFPRKYFTTYSNLHTMLSEVCIATPEEPEVYLPANARSPSYESPPIHGEWAQYFVSSRGHPKKIPEPSFHSDRNTHLRGIYPLNSILDEEGETAFHWESHLTVLLLSSAGRQQVASGDAPTPLQRSVVHRHSGNDCRYDRSLSTKGASEGPGGATRGSLRRSSIFEPRTQ